MLAVDDMTCRYGSVTAMEGASLRVGAGELVCILGSNGAGKSTLMKGIAGALKPARGRVTFEGRDLTGHSASEMVRAGVVMVPEGRRIFKTMSVADNLVLGAYGRARASRAAGSTRAEVLDLFPVLGEKLGRPAGTLSGGQQQMLAMAQALMGAPKLLILDEPSLGLSPSVTATVFDTIRALKRGGMAILLVEQMVARALSVADRGYVLKTGRIVSEGSAHELRTDGAVRAAYLGGTPAAERGAVRHPGQ